MKSVGMIPRCDYGGEVVFVAWGREVTEEWGKSVVAFFVKLFSKIFSLLLLTKKRFVTF